MPFSCMARKYKSGFTTFSYTMDEHQIRSKDELQIGSKNMDSSIFQTDEFWYYLRTEIFARILFLNDNGS